MAKLSQVQSHGRKCQQENIYRAPTGISVFRCGEELRRATLIPQGLQEEE